MAIATVDVRFLIDVLAIGNPTELCIRFQCFTVVNMDVASKKTAHSRMNPYFP